MFPKDIEEKLLINIHKEISLSVRTGNILKNQGIIFIEQLLDYSEKQLLSFPGAGKETIKEIKNILNGLGLQINSNFHFNKINKPENSNKNPKNFIEDQNIDFDLLSINILEEWPLSVRTYNALKKEKISFLGDIMFFGIENLMKIKNFGKRSYKELNNLFKINGIELDRIYFDHKKWEDFASLKKFKIKMQKNHRLRVVNKNK